MSDAICGNRLARGTGWSAGGGGDGQCPAVGEGGGLRRAAGERPGGERPEYARMGGLSGLPGAKGDLDCCLSAQGGRQDVRCGCVDGVDERRRGRGRLQTRDRALRNRSCSARVRVVGRGRVTTCRAWAVREAIAVAARRARTTCCRSTGTVVRAATAAGALACEIAAAWHPSLSVTPAITGPVRDELSAAVVVSRGATLSSR